MGGLFNPKTGLVHDLTPAAQTQNRTGSVLLSTSIDIIDEQGYAIGYIQQLSDNDQRPATKIRQIGAQDAGRVIEHAPGVSDITLQVQGFALYNRQEDGSIVQRLGGGNMHTAMKMLQEQKIGFKLLVVDRDPSTGRAVDATEYLDCWFTSKARPINIGQATMVENGNISCAAKRRPLNFALI